MVHYMPGGPGSADSAATSGVPEQATQGAAQDASARPGRVAAGVPTPRAIVEALDRHVVGQAAAKRAVAVALRSRARRLALPKALAEDVTPRNILMIGPTGVGKTEIARRLARLSGSPFLKVEASKYTEVGYVGRDVESMVRDLVAQSIHLVREEMEREARERIDASVEERLVDLLLPGPVPPDGGPKRRRDAVRAQLRAGHLDAHRVDVDVEESAPLLTAPLFGGGMDDLGAQSGGGLRSLFSKLAPPRRTTRTMSVAEARETLRAEESRRIVDEDTVNRLAVARAESSGIIFLDEIDKIAGREGGRGPEVSREGVQRDLLPIVEGTTVQTRWGPVRTDHVLFIAAGAFHVSKPSDLIPELQGRFPVRVQLDTLSRADLARILREPDASLLRQAVALLSTEGVELRLTDDAIEALAEFAWRVNEAGEDIGARRLHAVLETVLEDLSFRADAIPGTTVTVDGARVREILEPLARDRDLSRYVL